MAKPNSDIIIHGKMYTPIKCLNRQTLIITDYKLVTVHHDLAVKPIVCSGPNCKICWRLNQYGLVTDDDLLNRLMPTETLFLRLIEPKKFKKHKRKDRFKTMVKITNPNEIEFFMGHGDLSGSIMELNFDSPLNWLEGVKITSDGKTIERINNHGRAILPYSHQTAARWMRNSKWIKKLKNNNSLVLM